MRNYDVRFLEERDIIFLGETMWDFAHGAREGADLMDGVKELLPIVRNEQTTVYRRIEGLMVISNLLFELILEQGKALHGWQWNRSELTRLAKLRPFSYYHWRSGSREPLVNVLTRDDFYNDPSTALMKLEEDIDSLTKLFRRYQEEIVRISV